jgi:hypothetical protein
VREATVHPTVLGSLSQHIGDARPALHSRVSPPLVNDLRQRRIIEIRSHDGPETSEVKKLAASIKDI